MSVVREVRVPVATLWTGPAAARDVDAAAVRDAPDAAAWAAGVVTTELVGLTLTQLLMGEPVRVLEEQGEWLRVEALGQPSGHAAGAARPSYPGWLRRAHVGAAAERGAGSTVTVLTPSTTCRADQPLELSFGTTLGVGDLTGTEARVLLPDGRRGCLPLRDVALRHPGQPSPCGPDDVLGRARQFLGLRYVWGGTSGWGLDCSGLVHLTHRALGRLLPRDACDMAADRDALQDVPLEAVRPGDLYFFAKPGRGVTHVGLATRPVQADGARWMLHAPEGGGLIEECPMTADRLATLVSVARPR
ncbi:MAG: C40 family peptidase [Nocardioidaceae bacterium]